MSEQTASDMTGKLPEYTRSYGILSVCGDRQPGRWIGMRAKARKRYKNERE
ncbi:MAG: hypothetical protein NC081_06485 [Roseburia sp.]|nr:hypothetical protein [Roseburia sp.]